MSTEDSVINWAYERGILAKATPKDQMLKLMEEVGELAKAVNTEDINEIKDAIGDIQVVLIILANMYDTSSTYCLEKAYDVISKRTGTMVNGVFVKDE